MWMAVLQEGERRERGADPCRPWPRLSKDRNDQEIAMTTGLLTIDLDAVAANWRALAAMAGPGCATGAVVKADGYGCGAGAVAGRLAREGAREFFVAVA